MRFSLFVLLLFSVSCSNPVEDEPDFAQLEWDEIRELSEGEDLTLMMWMGDPYINGYMNDYVVPEVKNRYNIDLNIVSGQGAQIVSTLMAEIEGGTRTSQIDLVWINGETFFQLRQIDALYGPFTGMLPNSTFVNYDNPFIGTDFQQPVDGYEAPWGNVQFTLIYNPGQVNSPPQTFQDFETWIVTNPGRFTIPTEFAGMTLLKSWMMTLNGSPEPFYGDFDEELYKSASRELWDRLNRLKPYFWRNGETFPASVAQMHQLFANGEISFTMSNNDGEVDNKIARGLFPETSRAYVPEHGTIRNSHYLGIPRKSAHKAAALVVINFLQSPEAQLEKMKPDVWGDGTVLSIPDLPEGWQQRFSRIPGRVQAPDRSEIRERALQEPGPEYMIRIFEDFRTYVVNR
ncbi:ABC transporter substrate-binding protein [Rhodohalobacter mucosus]|uniref:ABC transporter substrate-binding protein n=1 Tax=Rhodohalobacter mucosus TaxID=2079485 RepID=A0A316TLN0_9BACT|nr:ABC transporter substrate-binding protein [Rhodohalobacter mucosus]